MKIIARLSPDQRALFWQLARYGVTGLFVTACQAAIYWTLAAPLGLHPQLANGIASLSAIIIGYVLHSAFTFRGHGAGGDHARRGARFLVVALISYGLNSLWVYLAVMLMGWAEWTPIPAMVFITPAVVFWLNRLWVFR